jgi:AcrR family transcriptional regulator
MAKISAEHAKARRRQILDAAHACFAREGFHRTSMQDIQREAELSAGALYVYFRSKDEIIEALVEKTARARGEIDAKLDPDAVARVMIALFHGFILQQAWDPKVRIEPYRDVVNAMLSTLVVSRRQPDRRLR